MWLILVQSTNSKREKVFFWSQKDSRGDYFLPRSAEKSGGWGNPFSAIDINAFRTTNFRSSSAMRGAEIHGNTRRDGPTRILSIGYIVQNSKVEMSFNLTETAWMKLYLQISN